MIEYKDWRSIPPIITWTGKFFYIRHGDLTLTNQSYAGPDLIFGTPGGIITGRSLAEYIHLRLIPTDFIQKYKNNAVCMIGCGLDELTYAFSRACQYLVTVIDPADYERLIFLLEFALSKNLTSDTRYQARQFITRANTILTSPKINYIPLPLQDAFNHLGDQLVGQFDNVVDIMGPLSSQSLAQGHDIKHMENMLLKPHLRRKW